MGFLKATLRSGCGCLFVMIWRLSLIPQWFLANFAMYHFWGMSRLSGMDPLLIACVVLPGTLLWYLLLRLQEAVFARLFHDYSEWVEEFESARPFDP